MKLKIGCLDAKRDGYIHIDIDPATHPDIVADAQDMHMIKDNSVDEIVCEMVLEHIQDTIKVMKEFHRILKPDGKLFVTVPHVNNINFWSTPDHCKGFTYGTFDQFWQPSHKNYPKFRCVRRKITTRNKFFQPLANKFPLHVEYLFWLFHLESIEAELEAIK